MKFYLLIFTALQIWSYFVTATPELVRVYGDVRENTEFFISVLPYLMDSFGGFLKVEYNILGHGIYAANHLCALKQLAGNNFLAAYYLKCEAEGRHPEACLCESGIDEAAYRSCVRTEGNALAKQAYWNYAQPYGSDWTPVVDYGNTIWKPIWSIKGGQEIKVYFNHLCSVFIRAQRPVICLIPLDTCPQRIGAARFDCSNPKPDSLFPKSECKALKIEPYAGSRKKGSG